jgi:hypothetical protein
MKKLLIILLLVVYGSSSFGMTLNFHYCCGRLDKIDFTAAAVNDCGKSQDPAMGSAPCCDNKTISLKITSEQETAKAFHGTGFPFSVTIPESCITNSRRFATRNLVPEVFAPPPGKRDLNRLYCIYRI